MNPGSQPWSVTQGCGQKLIPVYSRVPVKNGIRYTWLQPETESGVNTLIFCQGYGQKWIPVYMVSVENFIRV